MSICPCRRNQVTSISYEQCCEPIHEGKAAQSCEQLMRARYSAYVLGLKGFLEQSWHSSTRPDELSFEPDEKWVRLDVLSSSQNTVHFKAVFKENGQYQFLEERSNFTKEQGNWVYLDGKVKSGPFHPSRNEPCLCGSGKKTKKCCG